MFLVQTLDKEKLQDTTTTGLEEQTCIPGFQKTTETPPESSTPALARKLNRTKLANNSSHTHSQCSILSTPTPNKNPNLKSLYIQLLANPIVETPQRHFIPGSEGTSSSAESEATSSSFSGGGTSCCFFACSTQVFWKWNNIFTPGSSLPFLSYSCTHR
jgi:hypothetical protein